MDDNKIIDMLFTRNEDGVKELSSKYNRHARSLALSLLQSKEDAEECVNESWLKAWNSIPPNRPENMKAYISKIVRNLCLDRIRKGNAIKRPQAFYEVCGEVADTFNDMTEEAAQTHMLAMAINIFLSKLEDKNRILFVGRYWHLQGIKELSSLTGLSEANVKTTLYRLRWQLQEHLKKEGFEV